MEGIVHWDFDIRTRKFEAYNDPINDYASDKLVTVSEYMEVVHPKDCSVFNDAVQSMLSGEDLRLSRNFRKNILLWINHGN